MNDLLVGVLDAHGGVDRWARVHTITAHLSIGGPFWGRKGWPEIFGEQTTLELDTRPRSCLVPQWSPRGDGRLRLGARTCAGLRRTYR
jgi:hypothetical protein